jgi:hypothetical protein
MPAFVAKRRAWAPSGNFRLPNAHLAITWQVLGVALAG